MQGHFNPQHRQPHRQQQQLATLLSAAASTSGEITAEGNNTNKNVGDDNDKSECSRVGALDSLRRTILSLYPHNSLVISHSAPFLSHGLFQLLSDKSYAVRRAAAVAYGCLSAVLASTPLASNGLVDRFISWSLPLLGDIGSRNCSTEMAIASVHEFLNTGDAGSIERYVPSILKACQELLEDERTSFSLLQQLLGLLTLISVKFENCFQPYFVDIVDVLLGWAFTPELSEADRCVITDSFLQFQKQWLSNLHFSIGLLSKFLGDMEILIQDSSLEVNQQFGRLVALFSCFSTVLQVTASGIREMNLLEQINNPIENIAPRLLKFVLLFVSKFGRSNWIGQSWRCLIFLAEMLQEKFANFYSMTIGILFQSMNDATSSQVLGLIKTNMQLLSLQKLALLPSSVQTLLQFDSPFSQLRLHPNHHVVASSAATYLFLVHHGSDEAVSQAVRSLLVELEMLKSMLGETHCRAATCDDLDIESELSGKFNPDMISCKYYSETELLSFIKFDLKLLLCSVSIRSGRSSHNDPASSERMAALSSFFLLKLNPFDHPVQRFLELQVHVVRALHKLSEMEFLTKFVASRNSSKNISGVSDGETQRSFDDQPVAGAEYLKKYGKCLVSALDASSPLGVKLETLTWICTFGRMVSNMNKDADLIESFCEPSRNVTICSDLLSLILNAAYDREINLRSHVASVLEFLLQARLINSGDFLFVSMVSLDRLGDPDVTIRSLYVRVLSIILPLTIYACGFVDDRVDIHKLGAAITGNRSDLNWKQILALKQLPRKLHSHQLVSIISYISQRWKVPPSSWIQRLVFSCRGKREITPNLHEVDGDRDGNGNGLQMDAEIAGDMLDKMCPVSNLAALWWSIHEAARYCISLRLRTNLGGPTQTFAALERMLLDIPNVLLQDTEQSDGKYIGSYNFHLRPMRLLLEFVEALKKNVYNAYEGSSVLPCSPRQSSLFFWANKKVCEEWFSRICEPMMNAGLSLHCHDATIHYCAQRLQDLQNLATSSFKEKTRGTQENFHNLRLRLAADVFKVLRHASLSLCRKREPDALVGLQKWAVTAFSLCLMDDGQANHGATAVYRYLSWMNGLVYQAQGHYEKAAAYFSHLLQSEEALSSLGSDGIQFVIARVIESYTSLSDWKSLEIWLSELQALRAMHAGRAYSGALTAAGNELNAVHALARFDEGDFNGAWGYLDLTPKSSNELTLDPKVALERSEQMLLRSMLQRDDSGEKMSEDVKKAKLMLDEALSIVPLDGLTDAVACAVQLHCIHAFEEGRPHGLGEPNRIPGSLHQVLHSPITRIHQDCSLWIKVFRVYRTVMPTSPAIPFLGEKLLSLARKQKNFRLAERMNKYLEDHLLSYSYDNPQILSMKLHYEGILLKHAEGKHEQALIDLWSLVRTTVLTSGTFVADIANVLKAKACLKLSTWLRQESSAINLKKVVTKIHEDFNEHNAIDGSLTRPGWSMSDGNPISDAKWNIILEEMVGITTKASCNVCPTMGKAWLSYSAWCYNQAKSSLLPVTVLQSSSLSPVLRPEVLADRFQLTEEEISKVQAIVSKICHSSSYALIKNAVDEEHEGSISHPQSEALVNSLVQQTVYLMQAAAGAPGLEASNGECPSSALTSQLQILFLCMDVDMKKSDMISSLDELVDIWWSLRRRRVGLFGHAAHGYFQYLSNFSARRDQNHASTFHPDYVKRKAPSSTLRAMLYLLHILFNYGVELKETFELGFATVPLLPWQEITPQLFARLSSHPKEAVRKQLEGLLMMLAKLSPWSIVYPLLVDVNAYEGDPSQELQRILDCLAKLYPKLIQDVQLVINGLGTITVLWEEQWLNTLQDLHTDVARHIHMLKEEAARIAENSTLNHAEKKKINAAKYSAMMAPVIVALERRLASTSREPETAHESWFQKEYGQQLKSAILAFKIPPGSAAALGDVWRPFNAIATSLFNYQRKSTVYLSEVAPQLASLSSSDVPMPGLENQLSMPSSLGASADVQSITTISSFCEQVTILSTKTKPKKLVLMGSDGQRYTYLLKGREDLRLDARIMQLLQAVNSFLNSCTDTLSRSLSVRYYSVTPISGWAGLIQWVDNVTSMYSVYKSWQIRAQLAQLAAAGAGSTNSPVPPVLHPSDMFYGKIIPALKEKGIRRVISRRDWPHEVKRKVLLDLMKDTPRELLWQEMWCASEGFRGFSSKRKRFSGSVAAMSMVGHILGLGDRHLDNILMDFCSGDVVHIDYNICFDKGKRLKIPEIVPFRLTQTIEAALGLTGIEGTFRANCEAVIDVLRRNKDILLMLLEVFAWDPLLEWTRGDNHDEAAIGGEEKRGMELAVSLSLFASRFQEIRIPLQEHHDLLLSTLPAAQSAVQRFLDSLNQYEVASTIFYHADKERSSLLQHEASAKSIVAEATSISEKSQVAFEAQAHEFGQAKTMAVEKAQEAAMWVNQHGNVLDALRSGSVLEVQSFTRFSGMEEALSLISAVLVSGVPLTIVPEPTQAQCGDLDREVCHVITELDAGVSCAIEALHEYAFALQSVLPLNYITTSPVNSWAQVLQLSVNNLSGDILSLARRQAADLIAKAQGNNLDSVQQRHRDLFHRMEGYAKHIQKLDDECSEMMSSVGSDIESKAKESLLSAFTKYMQSVGPSTKEDDQSISRSGQPKFDSAKYSRKQEDLDIKKTRVLLCLHMAASELYEEAKNKVLNMSNTSTERFGWVAGEVLQPDSCNSFREIEEQIEKCVLVAGVVNEVQELMGIDLSVFSTFADNSKQKPEGIWASVFQETLRSCRHLIELMTDTILPDMIRSIISYNSEAMDAFGILSQIRGSIDTAIEKLVEVELERASLVELEKTYFVKVGFITEQQLALEEASAKGRDHLSWEEAEEITTQEEACRTQLEQLHQTWNQRDVRIAYLEKMESSIRNSLISSEQYFASLIKTEEDESHIKSSRILLGALVKPFIDLESIDQMLSLDDNHYTYLNESSFISDHTVSCSSLSESFGGLAKVLKNHSFFIWKVGILDSILDSCIHEISSSVDHNFGFELLYSALKKKIEIHLQEYVLQYLKKRVAPAFISQLKMQNQNLQQMLDMKDFVSDPVKMDMGAVRRVQLMLEEYCNAHETAKAARSAIFVMKRQINDLTEGLCKTVLEIIQMEWLHDASVPHLLEASLLPQNVLQNDKLSPLALNLSRPQLLEKIQSSMSSIGKSLECLQDCERTLVSAEGQLERAMGWACGGRNTIGQGNSLVKGSGIPSEFHDHLSRRREFLHAAREQACNLIKICTSVMEFEASRDGLFWMPGEKSSGRPLTDGRSWQQTYLSALTRLDAAYHSFTCAEQEWKLAQNKLEAAASGLFSATNELYIASAKAKSASDDLQNTLAAMRDSAYEASLALSAFVHVSKGHTTLTSECGSMLEEVLAISESLHDVYSLGKDAAAAHSALMEDLSKVNKILLPLEASLSADVSAIAVAIPKERESNADVPPVHGQALYKSYCLRLREACQSLTSLVPSVINSVQELHTTLTKLARSSSMHAGNLHKALEGLGESQVVRSQDLALSGTELSDGAVVFEDKDKRYLGSSEGSIEGLNTADNFSLQDEEWISPPDCTFTGSLESSVTSIVESLSETSERIERLQHSIDLGDRDKYVSSTNGLEDTHIIKAKSEFLGDEVHANSSATLVQLDPSGIVQASLSAGEVPLSHIGQLGSVEKEKSEEEKLLTKNDLGTSKAVERLGHIRDEPSSFLDPGSRNTRGKNPYALSVLRQVELKLDGREINNKSPMDIAEQVDYLLKQATSIDNLCNMYEGWTPWI